MWKTGWSSGEPTFAPPTVAKPVVTGIPNQRPTIDALNCALRNYYIPQIKGKYFLGFEKSGSDPKQHNGHARPGAGHLKRLNSTF